MHLHLKPTSKIVKPSTVVDNIFEAQGFEKRKRKDFSYYHLKMKDNITRTSYALQIPFQEIYSDQEPHYKIQEISICSLSPIMKNQEIPKPIVNAAREKASEVFSYLISHSKRTVH